MAPNAPPMPAGTSLWAREQHGDVVGAGLQGVNDLGRNSLQGLSDFGNVLLEKTGSTENAAATVIQAAGRGWLHILGSSRVDSRVRSNGLTILPYTPWCCRASS